jgi:hypothetical protein
MVRNTTEEPLVPLLEVSARLGTTEQALLARLDGQVRADWAGRPSVTIGEARRLVEEVERERREAEEAEAERQAAERAEQLRRQARYEQLLEEELAKETARVMEELRRSNVTVIAMTPPLSPADRRRAASRARARLEEEGK